MAFLLQLQLLIWKNLTLRKRHWGRLLIEIIWPLFLFVILFLVRLRGLKKFHHECECHFWNVSGLIWKLEISHLRQFWGEGDALCWDSTFCPNIYLHLQQHLSQVSWWWRWMINQILTMMTPLCLEEQTQYESDYRRYVDSRRSLWIRDSTYSSSIVYAGKTTTCVL